MVEMKNGGWCPCGDYRRCGRTWKLWKTAIITPLGMFEFLRLPFGMAPLTEALKGPSKSLNWSPHPDAAFCHVKALHIQVPELIYPCLSASISLTMQASEAYNQLSAAAIGWWRLVPFGLLLQELSDVEKNYSVFHRELLVPYPLIRHFRLMLEGREFL